MCIAFMVTHGTTTTNNSCIISHIAYIEKASLAATVISISKMNGSWSRWCIATFNFYYTCICTLYIHIHIYEYTFIVNVLLVL